MTTEQITKTLESMYSNSKSKNFINHLIRAYYKADKVKELSEAPKDFKCSLTREKLEIRTNDITPDDSKLGVNGHETNTFLSVQAYNTLTKWVMAKSVEGDKHINWIIGDIKKQTSINKVKEGEKSSKKNKISVATFSLGDSSDVLAKLKSQMDKK